jgi:hypothetical protein
LRYCVSGWFYYRNTVSINFPSEGHNSNFLETVAVVCFQCMLCRLVLRYVMMYHNITSCDDAARWVLTFEVITTVQVTAADVHLTARTVWAPLQYKLRGTEGCCTLLNTLLYPWLTFNSDAVCAIVPVPYSTNTLLDSSSFSSLLDLEARPKRSASTVLLPAFLGLLRPLVHICLTISTASTLNT